jgi:hypothetical protein
MEEVDALVFHDVCERRALKHLVSTVLIPLAPSTVRIFMRLVKRCVKTCNMVFLCGTHTKESDMFLRFDSLPIYYDEPVLFVQSLRYLYFIT